MHVIRSLAELDQKLRECNRVLQDRSDDEMRLLFNTFRMDFSADAPADPFAPEYRRFQMDVYETVARKPYRVENERSLFDVSDKVANPFPYYLKSAWTAGHHLLAIGFMLCKLDRPSGASILEFGPGWGSTTMELARLGYRVTTLDIDPNFCDVITARAAHLDVPVEVVNADFFSIETIDRRFDAALFFASFHHCDDHMRMLRALHRVIEPDGRVYLASEPIIAGYGTPWGVRMDGEALWAAHNFGWLELGFDQDYFVSALARTGWRGIRHDCSTVPWASVWELIRCEDEPAALAVPEAAVPPVPEPLPAAPEPSATPILHPGDRDAELAAGRRALLELEAMRRSTSWRLTRPLRSIGRRLGRRRKDLSLPS